MDKEHIHKWHTFTKQDMLICDGCNTLSPLQDVLLNIAKEAAFQERVSITGKQLFNHELKKKFHDDAYAWLMSQRGADRQELNATQARLL